MTLLIATLITVTVGFIDSVLIDFDYSCNPQPRA